MNFSQLEYIYLIVLLICIVIIFVVNISATTRYIKKENDSNKENLFTLETQMQLLKTDVSEIKSNVKLAVTNTETLIDNTGTLSDKLGTSSSNVNTILNYIGYDNTASTYTPLSTKIDSLSDKIDTNYLAISTKFNSYDPNQSPISASSQYVFIGSKSNGVDTDFVTLSFSPDDVTNTSLSNPNVSFEVTNSTSLMMPSLQTTSSGKIYSTQFKPTSPGTYTIKALVNGVYSNPVSILAIGPTLAVTSSYTTGSLATGDIQTSSSSVANDYTPGYVTFNFTFSEPVTNFGAQSITLSSSINNSVTLIPNTTTIANIFSFTPNSDISYTVTVELDKCSKGTITAGINNSFIPVDIYGNQCNVVTCTQPFDTTMAPSKFKYTSASILSSSLGTFTIVTPLPGYIPTLSGTVTKTSYIGGIGIPVISSGTLSTTGNNNGNGTTTLTLTQPSDSTISLTTGSTFSYTLTDSNGTVSESSPVLTLTAV